MIMSSTSSNKSGIFIRILILLHSLSIEVLDAKATHTQVASVSANFSPFVRREPFFQFRSAVSAVHLLTIFYGLQLVVLAGLCVLIIKFWFRKDVRVLSRAVKDTPC